LNPLIRIASYTVLVAYDSAEDGDKMAAAYVAVQLELLPNYGFHRC
jgi:hypothetical protein